MKKIILLLFILSTKSYACDCATMLTHDRYNKVEFVATVKITNIETDSINPKYRNFKFEIINLYKGKKIKSIKVFNYDRSMCNFYMPKGTRWLIYGEKDKNGILSVGYCSGSENLDQKFKAKKTQENYDNDLKWTLVLLQKWKENYMKAYLPKQKAKK